MTTAVPFADCERRFFERLVDLGLRVRCVVDVGGSNGAWSRSVSEAFPGARFELFEPLAGRRSEYDEVIAWLLETYPNMRVHGVALGATNGRAKFWNERHGVGSSLLSEGRPEAERIEVPVRRLDDYLAEAGIPQPEVVKLDVQGGEMMVIEGGRETIRGAEVLHIESWLVRGYGPGTPLLPELIEALRPLGHLLVEIGDFWRKPSEELVTVDAFFAHERLIGALRARGGVFPWRENWSPQG